QAPPGRSRALRIRRRSDPRPNTLTRMDRPPLTADSSRAFSALAMLGRPENEAVIEVVDVRKSYADVKAVDGVSFEVARGEIFGLLGPNGAGKTTTMELLEGLHPPDA